MSDKWRYIRRTISRAYPEGTDLRNIVITGIDSNFYVYYIDLNGDEVKLKYPSAIPIVVDSETEIITFDSVIYLAGVSAWTYTYSVLNENSLDVTDEITFTADDAAVIITGGTNGRIISAVGEGTAAVTLYHEDWDGVTNPTASGVTDVTVGQVNTQINSSGGTLSDGQVVSLDSYDLTPSGGTEYYLTGLTFYNQLSDAIVDDSTALLRYTINGGSPNTMNTTWTPTGTTQTVVIYDVNAKTYNAAYSGATYTATLVW